MLLVLLYIYNLWTHCVKSNLILAEQRNPFSISFRWFSDLHGFFFAQNEINNYLQYYTQHTILYSWYILQYIIIRTKRKHTSLINTSHQFSWFWNKYQSNIQCNKNVKKKREKDFFHHRVYHMILKIVECMAWAQIIANLNDSLIYFFYAMATSDLDPASRHISFKCTFIVFLSHRVTRNIKSRRDF